MAHLATLGGKRQNKTFPINQCCLWPSFLPSTFCFKWLAGQVMNQIYISRGGITQSSNSQKKGHIFFSDVPDPKDQQAQHNADVIFGVTPTTLEQDQT